MGLVADQNLAERLAWIALPHCCVPNPLYLGDGMADTPLFFPSPQVGYSSLCLAEESPMTYHAILFTNDLKGFVWITEHSAFLGRGHENFATTEKVTHLKEHGVAFSGWGDLASMEAQTHFANAIKSGSLLLPHDDPETVKTSL